MINNPLKSLHRYTLFVAFSTLVLIFAGGLVTSTGSGLSVTDWPLSYGSFFPPMIGGIRFEHTHRLIAGFVGILTLILMIFTLRKEKRFWVRLFGVITFLLVVVQAILGGMTVRFLLPKPVSISHACLAQTFFTFLILLALFTSREWRDNPRIYDPRSSSIKRLCTTTLFFVYGQMIAGAIVRHTAGGSFVYHLVGALFIYIHVISMQYRFSKSKETSRLFLLPATLLNFFVTTQIFLGFGTYIYKFLMEKTVLPRTAEVLLATFHQTTGAVILALTALLTIRAYRLLTRVNTSP